MVGLVFIVDNRFLSKEQRDTTTNVLPRRRHGSLIRAKHVRAASIPETQTAIASNAAQRAHCPSKSERLNSP